MAEWNPDDWNPDGTYKRRKRFKPVTLIAYRTDAIVKRSYTPACAGQKDAVRGRVGAAPSRRSLNNLVFLLNNCDTPMRSMFTITMTDKTHARNSVEFHKQTLRNALQRMRWAGINQYCWVREFQGNDSVHWHVFTDLSVMSKPGAVSKRKSKEWSEWMVASIRERGRITNDCARKMVTPSVDGFVGCIRVEQLKGNEGGKYAGKEGSKRFQKIAPPRWRRGGCWWYASRNIKCSPIGEIKVNGANLNQATVEINGVEQEIAYRNQYNRGLRYANGKLNDESWIG